MKISLLLTLVLIGLNLLGHTTTETNEIVRTMLRRARSFSPRDNMLTSAELDLPENSWQNFLGLDGEQGWLVPEKRQAFNWYLSKMATNDFQTIRGEELLLFRSALFQCGVLGYTNAVLFLKALARNPNGKFRRKAIELSVVMGNVDDDTTGFVETIITNQVSFTQDERGTASGYYAKKIIGFTPTNDFQRYVKNRACDMFYHHRTNDVVGAGCLDDLFVTHYEGYAMSSNRLHVALYVLSHPECADYQKKEFAAVTNRLLSSGIPLRQLTISEGGYE